MKILQGGYTTGACVAAGVKAVMILWSKNIFVESVEITALDGTLLTIPIKLLEVISDVEVKAEVIKYSGDDPDITNGASIFTYVKRIEGTEIIFKAGLGVGTITKPGLALPVGEPAINKGPRQLIRNVVDEFYKNAGLEITISIPAGVELAKKTLNPVLGVKGGLSVIGTTGVLRPMSEEAFKKSLIPQIDVAQASGFKTLVFVPGKIGAESAIKIGIPQGAIVETSNFIGYMLENAAARKINQILLFGHLGKLAKVAGGVFYTHNRIADGRMETIAAYAAAAGLNQSGVKKILESNTTEEAMKIIEDNKLDSVYKVLAERASIRAQRYVFNEMTIGTAIIDLEGRILGIDTNAEKIIPSLITCLKDR